MSDTFPDRSDRIIATALFVAVVLVFGRTTSFGFVEFDDPLYVQRESHVLGGLTAENVSWAMTTTHLANWHPLTWMSYMADVTLFGGGPAVHHGVNVALHAANTLLLYVLLRTMTGRVAASAFAAALFAVHPLRVESVAWISERKDVQYVFFSLLACLAYVRFARTGSWRWYAAVVVTFAASLMTKGLAVTLPCVFLLLDFWPLERQAWGRRVLEKLPLFAMSIATGVMAIHAARVEGAVSDLESMSLAQRLGIATLGYGLYLGKMVWPVGLCCFHPLPPELRWGQIAIAGTVLVAITGIAVLRARRSPYLLVGWLWFLGTLFPVSGVMQAGGQLIADRYTYFPMIGLFVAVCWTLDDLVRTAAVRRIVAPVGAGIVVALALLAVRQVGTWRTSETLFEHAYRVSRPNTRVLASLGGIRVESGRMEEGLELLHRSLELDPDDYMTLNRLGVAAMKEQRYADAEEWYLRAVEVRPAKVLVHANLALAQARDGRPEDAIETLERAIEIDPEYGRAWAILSEVHRERGDEDRAEECLVRALEVDPYEPRANRRRATQLVDAGDVEGAVAHLERAVSGGGSAAAYVQLGVLLEQLGRRPEAQTAYERATAVDPRLAVAWMNLGNVLAADGALPEAAKHYRRAVELDPELDSARENLALVEAQLVRAGYTP